MPIADLWLHSERRTLLTRLGAAPAPPAWFASLASTLGTDTPAAREPEPGHCANDGAIAKALRAFLQGDSALAARALADWRAGLVHPSTRQDLGKARLSLTAAILYDLNHALWSSEEAAAWRQASLDLVTASFRLSSGNPHHIGNNWWAVTHSALYCLCVALHTSGCTDAVPPAARTVPEIEEWSWSRLDAFLGHFGDAGAYHEGLGYQDYTCSFLLPAALLRERRSGSDLALRFPGLSRLAELLFLSGLEGPGYDDTTGQRSLWGRQLSWNDAGLGWPEGAVPLLALHWASPSVHTALLPRWNRLSGPLRPDNRLPARFGALFFLAALHPDAEPSATTVLPLSLCDRKQGLWLVRDAHAGASDALLGAYARCHHPAGHSQHDAGSFRFSALGWEWVVGGGQGRPEAAWQSVVVSSDAPAKPGCGAVLHVSESVFGMELRQVLAAYAERYLAFHPATATAPLAVAVLDLIDDHRSDRDWEWRLTTSPEHGFVADGDGLGFTLIAPDGAALHVRFLGEPPVALTLEQSPGSCRTFASGTRKTYRSRPCVVARLLRRPSLSLYAVLTVAPAGSRIPSPVLIPGAGLSVAWGPPVASTPQWDRPFGPVFPGGIPPSRLRGQCPHPAPLSA